MTLKTPKKSIKNESTGEKKLTEVELELVTILWRLEGGTVNEVLAELPAQRQLAYTSVSTVLRILEQKGVLRSRKEGRGHLYLPLLSKEKYEASSLQHLVTKVFDGTPSALVKRLLESEGLTDTELQSIRALLNEHKS